MKRFKINIEHVLFISCAVSFFILIAVQAGLLSPIIRTFLEVQNDYAGQPLDAEEVLYKEGGIGLQLVNADSNEELRALVNGETVGAFAEKSINIKVKDGDVVEIDGCGVKNDMEVEIVSKSENIRSQCIGNRVKVKENVKRIIRVETD